MQEKSNWKEGNPVYGLPKLKALRIKIKKEKVEKAETPADGAAPAPAAGGAKEGAKAAPGAPKAAAKVNEKK